MPVTLDGGSSDRGEAVTEWLKPASAPEESAVSNRSRMSALWAALVLLYLYADVLSLFKPGQIEDITEGRMGPVESTQATLLLASTIVIIPALMVFLTLVMPARIGRRANLVLGVLYTAVSAGNLIGETWAYYLLFGALEMAVAVLIVVYAWKWQPDT
jgi:hypothetical protein